LRRCGQALFVPQKSKNYCFFGFKNDTLLFISLFGVWVPPPPPPGGQRRGVILTQSGWQFAMLWTSPPTRGVPPPDPLFGGIQTYVVHFFQIRSEGVLIVPHLDITTFSPFRSTVSRRNTLC